MTVFYRLKRLIKSDMHALIEGLEEPKWILAQSLRDMEEELEKLGQRLDQAERELVLRQGDLEETLATISECEEKIQLSLSEQKEDTARFFIRKQILLKKKVNGLSKEIQRSEAASQALKKELDEKTQAYDEVCVQSEAILAAAESSEAFACAKGLAASEPELEHEVELEFLRRVKEES